MTGGGIVMTVMKYRSVIQRADIPGETGIKRGQVDARERTVVAGGIEQFESIARDECRGGHIRHHQRTAFIQRAGDLCGIIRQG